MGQSWSSFLRTKSRKAGEDAMDLTVKLPVDDKTGEKLHKLETGQIEIQSSEGERIATNKATYEQLQLCLKSVFEAIPDEVKASVERSAGYKMALAFANEGERGSPPKSKLEYFKFGNNKHFWVLFAIQKNKEDLEKVDFFMTYLTMECDDNSSELLCAELIRRGQIGYDETQNVFKYIAD